LCGQTQVTRFGLNGGHWFGQTVNRDFHSQEQG